MGATAIRSGPFSLDFPREGRFARWLTRIAARGLESALGLSRLNQFHAACVRDFAKTDCFCDVVLRQIGVRVVASDAEVSRIPASGPAIVVANHPFGALEGLIVESLVRRVRSDVRVLSNHLLSRIPEVRESSIFVDPFGGRAARDRNTRPMRESVEHLQSGGVLIVFPAGEVASYKVRDGKVVEPQWNRNAARLALRTGATVTPMHIEGRNSALFHAAGLIHPLLRTALLPREFLRMKEREVRVNVGTPIPAERLKRFKDGGDATDYLRLRSLILGARSPRRAAKAVESAGMKPANLPPVVAGEDRQELARELAALPSECGLLTSGDFQVFAARAEQIPMMLREIARLREVTFRAVGEGTGKALDLDRFDDQYLHLFAWDRAAERMVGAYRLGFTEELLSREGVTGLYTHTLFRYDHRWLDQVGPAIELGRSFVTAEYQKSYAALLLLWKGIARVVSRSPQCRRLFGVVSVSAEFDSMTQRLLMAFLRVNNYDTRSAEMVFPRTPPKVFRRQAAESEQMIRLVESIDDMDELVREIESDQRSVPILLRQYLKLGGQVLGFNVDAAFGHVLDAMIVIDLTRTPRPILDRFFGRGEAEAFLAHHAESTVLV